NYRGIRQQSALAVHFDSDWGETRELLWPCLYCSRPNRRNFSPFKEGSASGKNLIPTKLRSSRLERVIVLKHVRLERCNYLFLLARRSIGFRSEEHTSE